MAHEGPPLAPAAGDDHSARVGHHAAHSAQVVSQGEAKDLAPLRIGVAEVGVPHPGERLAEGAEPGGAGEDRQVGDAGAEVVERRRRRLRTPGGGRLAGSGAAGDARPGARAELQVPLPGELGVRVHHDRPGDAQLAGEVSGRGEPGAGMEARGPGSHGGAGPRSGGRGSGGSPGLRRRGHRGGGWSGFLLLAHSSRGRTSFARASSLGRVDSGVSSPGGSMLNVTSLGPMKTARKPARRYWSSG